MSIRSDGAFTRALNRYVDAQVNKAFEGTIPVHSKYPEEQEMLDNAHAAIDRELARSRDCLLDLVDRRLGLGEKP